MMTAQQLAFSSCGRTGQGRIRQLERLTHLCLVLGVALHRLQLLHPMCKLALAAIPALASCFPASAHLSLQST